MRIYLILTLFLQYVIAQKVVNKAYKWRIACENEHERMKIELPRLLNIERGKLARGERTYKDDKSGKYLNYPSATNMEQVKWTSERESSGRRRIKEYIAGGKIDGNLTFHPHYRNETHKDLMSYFTARMTKNVSSCQKAWQDWVHSNDQIKLIVSSSEPSVYQEVPPIYHDEIRLESLKSRANVTEIGCHQLMNEDNDILTMCYHSVYSSWPVSKEYEVGKPCDKCPNNTRCNSLQLCSSDPFPSTMSELTTTGRTTIQVRTTEKPTTRVATIYSSTPLVMTTEKPIILATTTQSSTTLPVATRNKTTRVMVTRNATTSAVATKSKTTRVMIPQSPTTLAVATKNPITRVMVPSNSTTSDVLPPTTSVNTTESPTSGVTTTQTPSTQKITTEASTIQVFTTESVPNTTITTLTVSTKGMTTQNPFLITEDISDRDSMNDDTTTLKVTTSASSKTTKYAPVKSRTIYFSQGRTYVIVFLLLLVLIILVFVYLHYRRERPRPRRR